MGNKKLIQALALATFLGITTTVLAQITERPRPVSWEQLVPGARFMDRFLPMQGSRLVADSWGAKGGKLRLADNGIESRIYRDIPLAKEPNWPIHVARVSANGVVNPNSIHLST